MKHAGQKSSKEELAKQRKGPKRTEECRLKVPTHIWELEAASSSLATRTKSHLKSTDFRWLFAYSPSAAPQAQNSSVAK